jgi:hypothetical protein
MAVFQALTEDSWMVRLMANHMGFISFAIPVAVLFFISKNSMHTRCKYINFI